MDPKQVLEQLRQIKQQMQGSGAPGGGEGGDGPHGALEVDGPDHPASWFADSDGPSGSSVNANVNGSGSGSTHGSGAGSGSAVAAAGGGSAAGASDIKATDETLPTMDAVAPPKVSEQGPTPRVGKLPGLGGKDILDAVFDELSPGMLGKRVYAGEDGSYVLIQLKTRHSVDTKDFDKDGAHVISELRHRRAAAAVFDFLKNRCETLAKANKIKANQEYIREHDDQGNPLPSAYHPCMSFAQDAAAMQGGGAE
jgi:hypothetical protein